MLGNKGLEYVAGSSIAVMIHLAKYHSRHYLCAWVCIAADICQVITTTANKLYSTLELLGLWQNHDGQLDLCCQRNANER